MSYNLRHRSGATAKWIDIIRNDPCVYCGGPSGTTEHVVCRTGAPRMLDTGFSRDHWTNLVPACWKCNRRRSDKKLVLFMLGNVGQ